MEHFNDDGDLNQINYLFYCLDSTSKNKNFISISCQWISLVSLPLQLMKVTVLAESYNYLPILIMICQLQRCLLTVAR